MPSAALQAKIAVFESRISPPTMLDLSSNRSSDGSESLLETPISPTAPSVQSTPLKAAKLPLPPQLSPSPSPPNLGRKTSLIDLKDWVVDDEFAEAGNAPRSARNHADHSSNGAGPQNALTAPLIKLNSPPKVNPKPKHLSSKRITTDAGAPTLPPRRPDHTLRPVASSSSLQSPSTSFLYPSRRNDSLTVDARHTYPPTLEASLRPKTGHVPTSSISSFHSVSLSSDTDPSTPLHIATFPIELEPERDFSVRSYGSDSISLSESYEEVPSIIAASPATERIINIDWGRASAQQKARHTTIPRRPPPSPKPTANLQTTLGSLPVKAAPSTLMPPMIQPSLSSSSTTTISSTIDPKVSRRVPPPLPPSRASDRNSMRSITTSESAFLVTYPTYQSNQSKPVAPQQTIASSLQSSLIQKTRRPTPIPPKARKRYEGVFNVNVIHLRKVEKQREVKPVLLSPPEARKSRSRQAAGWRGLSIDLTTAAADHPMTSKVKDLKNRDDKEPVNEVVSSDDFLEGCVVRYIWIRSGLDKSRLRIIWNECDTEKKGILDRESFVRGMWRIDEELRRAHTEPLKFARSTGRRVGSRVGRKEVLPPRIKPILT